jgi:hypothetical protein
MTEAPRNDTPLKKTHPLFRLADQLKEHIDRASRSVDRSTQAIRAKAFRGDLISTDAPV